MVFVEVRMNGVMIQHAKKADMPVKTAEEQLVLSICGAQNTEWHLQLRR